MKDYKSLKEFVSNAFMDENDMTIIYKFLEYNDLESQGIEMMAQLSARKVEKQQQRLNYIESWGTYATDFFYDLYDRDLAIKLDKLCRIYIIYKELTDKDLEILEGIKVKLKEGQQYFRPVFEILEEKGLIEREN